jgi:hypothetical protein
MASALERDNETYDSRKGGSDYQLLNKDSAP